MIAFWALVRKDLRIFFGDPRAVIMAFIAPILIGSFFGYVFGSVGKPADRGKLKVLLVDPEPGRVTKQILDALQREPLLEVATSDLATAEAQVKRGRTSVALLFPKGFSEAVGQALFNSSSKPEVKILFDPSQKFEAGMVQGILTGILMQAITRASSPANLSLPFLINEEPLTARSGVPYNSYAHSFGGMAIQFMLFMGIDVGMGMLLLRERGLWRRFRAAPLSKAVLLGSRAFSAMLVGLLILTVVFAFARIVFGVKIEGSVLGFLGICAAFSLMTATYGLLIAALAKTPEAARGLATLATLLMVMLSGAWVPSFIFPAWLQSLTNFVPPRWAMDGLDAMVWRGLGLADALLPIGVLLVSSVIFGTLAVIRFRWDAE